MIHRFLAWLRKLMTAQRSVRTTICDLPAEFGERMRLETVRGVFVDESARVEEMRNAMVQLLWMHRAQAIEDGRDAARAGEGEKAVGHFGAVDFVDNVISDVQHLRMRGGKWEAGRDVKQWFRE